MNVLVELEKARKMVEEKTLRLEDFEALLIGLFHRASMVLRRAGRVNLASLRGLCHRVLMALLGGL